MLDDLLRLLLKDKIIATITIELSSGVQPVEREREYVSMCHHCGNTFAHESKEAAERALRTHLTRHCANADKSTPNQWIQSLQDSKNGSKKGD